MKKAVLYILIITLPIYVLPEEKPVGQAAKEGTSNASTIAWAVFGAVFLVTIGVVAAVAISQSNKDKVIIVQN